MKQKLEDVKEGLTKQLEKMAPKDDTPAPTFNPMDPTKFYQQPQQDNLFQDAALFSAFVALLYFLYKGLQNVNM